MYYLQSRYYDPEIGRFVNADDYVSTGKDFIGYNMLAYCNNNPIIYRDSSGKVLVGAIIGGAIGGALISVVSHLTTNPDATVGSTLLALAVGAGTGALGGWAGTLATGKVIVSVATGVISGIYTGLTTSGDVLQKIEAGIVVGGIAALGTFCGTQFDTTGFDRFGTAVANYATTVFVGSVTEPIAVVAQQQIAEKSASQNSTLQRRTAVQQHKWELMRKKEARLLAIRY